MPFNPTDPPGSTLTNDRRFVSALESQLKSKKKGGSEQFVSSTAKMPLLRPASVARKNRPQNSKVFQTQSLPDGGCVSYFAVPGKDGARAKSFFSDEMTQDLGSSQRLSYSGSRPKTHERGNTQRYGCTQQPWALATLGNKELGIVPDHYEHKLRSHTESMRRVRTAPETLGGPSNYGQYRRKLQDIQDDLMSVVGDHVAADTINTWLAQSSRLERSVVSQMFQDVSGKLKDVRSEQVRSRPGTRQGIRLQPVDEQPAWRA